MARQRPVPLVSTAYDITIHGGLAAITARRTFRNVEATSIEATLTFPLPVHAVLFALEAKIGSRVLKAAARVRSEARANYEAAIDAGKTTVLHEELIRGVHLLSVGHIAPGTDIEVTAYFALPLTHAGDRATLRIPTTVGDVYGTSGLADCDDLAHGGPLQSATLSVACSSGEVTLVGGTLADGRASIRLDTPIDLEVRRWTPRPLAGLSRDGRAVTLSIEPAANASDAAIDAAILVDHSGSMAEPCSHRAGLSKHAAALLGLSDAARDLRLGDSLHLFEFDDELRPIGIADVLSWAGYVHQLTGPRGGTEIGRAIAISIAQSNSRDIVLVTDGKSHALEVQHFASLGRRFTVVLIGEDSLEANVGHLAALTGGEIFVPLGTDVAASVRSALAAVRSGVAADAGRYRRGGMDVSVAWQETPAAPATFADAGEDPFARAVAAYATSLGLSSLTSEEAARAAAAEGLVTHLTSLILVDEEGAAQQGLPATRKVALPSPARAARMPGTYTNLAPCDAPRMYMRCAAPLERYDDAFDDRHEPPAAKPERGERDIRQHFTHGRSKRVLVAKASRPGSRGAAPAAAPVATPVPADAIPADLAGVPASIDWATHASELVTGNLAGLGPALRNLILDASANSAVVKAARRAKISRVLLVIGILARAADADDRHAARVARTILGQVSPRLAGYVAARLGLAGQEEFSAA